MFIYVLHIIKYRETYKTPQQTPHSTHSQHFHGSQRDTTVVIRNHTGLLDLHPFSDPPLQPSSHLPNQLRTREKMCTKPSRFTPEGSLLIQCFLFPELSMMWAALSRSDTPLLTNGTIPSSPPLLPSLPITTPPDLWHASPTKELFLQTVIKTFTLSLSCKIFQGA